LFLILKVEKVVSKIKNQFLFILKCHVRCHVGTTAQSVCAT